MKPEGYLDSKVECLNYTCIDRGTREKCYGDYLSCPKYLALPIDERLTDIIISRARLSFCFEEMKR